MPAFAPPLAAAFSSASRLAMFAEATQWALGCNHALSKRTGIYTAYSDIPSKGGLSVAGVAQGLKPAFGDASYPGTGYQRGFQVGIKHAF